MNFFKKFLNYITGKTEEEDFVEDFSVDQVLYDLRNRLYEGDNFFEELYIKPTEPFSLKEYGLTDLNIVISEYLDYYILKLLPKKSHITDYKKSEINSVKIYSPYQIELQMIGAKVEKQYTNRTTNTKMIPVYNNPLSSHIDHFYIEEPSTYKTLSKISTYHAIKEAIKELENEFYNDETMIKYKKYYC